MTRLPNNFFSKSNVLYVLAYVHVFLSGGWPHCKTVQQITGSIAIEFGNQTYIKALDNGLFTLGAPHDHGMAKILLKFLL